MYKINNIPGNNEFYEIFLSALLSKISSPLRVTPRLLSNFLLTDALAAIFSQSSHPILNAIKDEVEVGCL